MPTTFWALTVIPKDQLKGSKNFHKTSTSVEKPSIPAMVKPMYETEADVTRAIAAGTKQIDPNYPTQDPYLVARNYQKYLKLIAPKFFIPKKKTANRNGLYNHTMSFGR